MSKILIVYYSYSKTTKSLAEYIAKITKGHIKELIPVKPYTFAHNGATKDVRMEIERGYCPKILPVCESVEEYDYIFIGTPNWFKTFAPPILSFLRGTNLKGKTIIPFCTHGGGGIGQIAENIKKECQAARVLQGFSATSDYNETQVQQWLDEIMV